MAEEAVEFFAHSVAFTGQAPEIPKRALLAAIDALVARIERDGIVTNAGKSGDWTVLRASTGEPDHGARFNMYTGPLGVAMMYYHLFCKTNDDRAFFGSRPLVYLSRADEILRGDLAKFFVAKDSCAIDQGVGMFCGRPGYLALRAAVSTAVSQLRYDDPLSPWLLDGRIETSRSDATWALKELESMTKTVLQSTSKAIVDELLYGTAGFMWASIFVRGLAHDDSQFAGGQRDAQLVALAAKIITNGKAGAAGATGHPMLWETFGRQYLGAAHGSVGIAMVLVEVFEVLSHELKADVVALLNALADLAGPPNTSFPVRYGSKASSHFWCHGYPGLIPLLVRATVVLRNPRYLAVARHCAEIVFREGVLRKGRGLCHGAFGNAYSFLALYRATREDRYLFYAQQFYQLATTPEYAQSIATYDDSQRRVQGVPDSPFSLMEGSAGEVCFLVDLIFPDTSNFPGYELPFRRNTSVLVSPLLSIGNGIARTAWSVAPGVWAVPVLTEAAAAALAARIDKIRSAPSANPTQAIALGADFALELADFTAWMQHFAETQMIRTDIGRIARASLADVRFDIASGAHDDEHLGAASIVPRHAQLADKKAVQAILRSAASEIEQDSLEALQQQRVASIPRLQLWRAYAVVFDAKTHPSIQSHIDACDVSFNLCLRRSTFGAHLVFNEFRAAYQHVPGEATVFWGDIVHHTHNVKEGGERMQLVLLFNFAQVATALEAQQPAAVFPILSLPVEVQGVIMSFLAPRDLAKVSYVCRALCEVANDDDMWLDRFRRDQRISEIMTPEAATSDRVCYMCGGGDNGCLFACEKCNLWFHYKVVNFDPATNPCTDKQNFRLVDAVKNQIECPRCRTGGDSSNRVPELIRRRAIGHLTANIDGRRGWKLAFRDVLGVGGVVDEVVRKAQVVPRPRFFRATTGIFPMHNVRRRLPDEDITHVVSSSHFVKCPECLARTDVVHQPAGLSSALTGFRVSPNTDDDSEPDVFTGAPTFDEDSDPSDFD